MFTCFHILFLMLCESKWITQAARYFENRFLAALPENKRMLSEQVDEHLDRAAVKEHGFNMV